MSYKKYTVKVYADGYKEWFQNGKRHREDGPAIEYDNGNKFWCQDGQYHREDGPAIEWANGDKEWYLNGVRFSEKEFLLKVKKDNCIDNTVRVCDNGDKHWLQNGQSHREDGPAIEFANGDKYWYQHGQYHRNDGPAIELANGYKEWYLNGVRHSEKEFLLKVKKDNCIDNTIIIINDKKYKLVVEE